MVLKGKPEKVNQKTGKVKQFQTSSYKNNKQPLLFMTEFITTLV